MARPKGSGHNYANETYNFLTFIRIVGQTANRTPLWEIQCICGRVIVRQAAAIKAGHVKSCGCKKEQLLKEASTIHGESRSKEYLAWKNLIRRCYCKTDKRYYAYGARGIRVCKRWRTSFDSFLDDMGRAPGKEYSIERRRNNDNYQPDNCYWGTRTDQANNKRNNVLLTYDGRTQTVAQWSRETSIDRATINVRLGLGWTVADALTKPLRQRNDEKPIAHNGQSLLPAEWSRITGLPTITILKRLYSWHWSIPKTLETPHRLQRTDSH